MTDQTIYVVIDGGVVDLRYTGTGILYPGDVLRVEVRDFDVDEKDAVLHRKDDAGHPYVGGLTLKLRVRDAQRDQRQTP